MFPEDFCIQLLRQEQRVFWAKIPADDILKIYIFLFIQENRFDISCKLSPKTVSLRDNLHEMSTIFLEK